ncbi:MAG: hypothetical protein LUC34_03480 [Campylobacter sp.]|nr:hypothetical protein [Campylobacter sp.]
MARFKQSSFGEYVNKERESKEFLTKVFENFIKESLKAYETWEGYHFVGNEKQSLSSLIPAIYKRTENIWLEQPFVRTDAKSKQENEKERTQRFIDIVTCDTQSSDEPMYFIEVKHGFHGMGKQTLRKYCVNRWERAIEQIKNITYRNLTGIYIRHRGDKYYKVAFMIITTYKGCKKKNEVEITPNTAKENAEYIFNALKSTKDYTPDMVMSYKLDDPSFIQYANGCEIYPFVSVAVKIENLSISKKENECTKI